MQNFNIILIDINIDGIPLFKSSSTCLWPILGKIVGCEKTTVFPIGIYVGKKKPFLINSFLHDFVSEVRVLVETGCKVGAKRIPFQIRAFICDAPARSFVCSIVGHNSFHGCSKCMQRGYRVKNTTTFATSCGILRTNESFKNKIDIDFHRTQPDGALELEKLGIDMISQFPLDPMHLIDLGVVRKMLNTLLSGKSKACKLKDEQKQLISSTLLSFVPHIPTEFGRKPRSLEEIPRWKAIEFRQFILYTGIVVFKNIVTDDFYYHFCLLHCAYRLLSVEKNYISNLDPAQEMLTHFVEQFPIVYAEEKVSYNVHSLLHLVQSIKNTGFISSFSFYRFENYLQNLKKLDKKPSQILQQLNNKIQNASFVEKDQLLGPKINKTGQITSFQSSKFYLSSESADRFVCLHDGSVFAVKHICSIEKNIFIIGNRILNCSSFYDTPVSSMNSLGIFEYGSEVHKQHRSSTGKASFHLMFGTNMRIKNESSIRELLDKEWVQRFDEERNELTLSATMV